MKTCMYSLAINPSKDNTVKLAAIDEDGNDAIMAAFMHVDRVTLGQYVDANVPDLYSARCGSVLGMRNLVDFRGMPFVALQEFSEHGIMIAGPRSVFSEFHRETKIGFNNTGIRIMVPFSGKGKNLMLGMYKKFEAFDPNMFRFFV